LKIALFGAGGHIGSRIAEEAAVRGHEVTAVVRDVARFAADRPGIRAVQGDILDPASVARAVAGHDAVVNAVGPKLPEGDPQIVVQAARTLLAEVPKAGVRRLLIVGGAGSLEVAPGVDLVDTAEFPEAWKGIALAHRDALRLYRTAPEGLLWTYVSPAAFIEPGERTGHFRIGTDQLLTDERGESRISIEDYAAALVDELENPRFPRQRITVAY